MVLKFTDNTKLKVETFYLDQMSDRLFIYLHTNNFNSLIPIFTTKSILENITTEEDNGNIETYSGYTNTMQFFGIVENNKLFVTVVLGKENQL